MGSGTFDQLCQVKKIQKIPPKFVKTHNEKDRFQLDN